MKNSRIKVMGLITVFTILISTLSLAQNLVTNPSFETYSSLPSGPGQWSNATGWSNVNGWIPFQWPYASPDYCHFLGSGNVKLPNTVFGTVNAYSGNAVMGLVMYYPSTPNFREYIAGQLTAPMVVGQTYTISFRVTNGVAATIGGMGIRNFGVCLSVGSLYQLNNEPIIATPQYTPASILYNTGWQLISFNIVATAAWNRITFGNFNNDAATVSQVFMSVSNPSAYYFLDDVSVAAIIPLPVELLDFRAESRDNKTVDLNWTTASELNNDFFTVQRTQDGINWEDLSEVDGAGNSTGQLSYHDIDRAPFTGTSYYRLKQTDFDGKFEYSETQSVHITPFGASEILIYPNPTSNQFTIHGTESELSDLKIYSEIGQDLTNLTRIKIEGQTATVDLSELSAGMYTVKLQSSVHRVCKQ